MRLASELVDGDIYEIPTANVTLNRERLKAFTCSIRNNSTIFICSILENEQVLTTTGAFHVLLLSSFPKAVLQSVKHLVTQGLCYMHFSLGVHL